MTNAIHHNNGPALAAILAAGIGCAVLGIVTLWAEASAPFKALMLWWPPAGPLTGKTTVAVIAWLVSWIGLHLRWRHLEMSYTKVWTWTLVLIALGWIGTFPPVFEWVGKVFA